MTSLLRCGTGQGLSRSTTRRAEEQPSVVRSAFPQVYRLHRQQTGLCIQSSQPSRQGVETQAYSNEVADTVPERMGEAARKALSRATTAVKRYGWISFWLQLTLSVVSAVILLFSVAFTSQSGPRASLYLTLLGILAGFLSTFWNFSYTRTGLKMQRYLEAPPGSEVPKVKKQTVVDLVTRGIMINLLGLGSTLLGIQALVGVLVAKTLSNATANPFIASAAGVYNPVLALDVFLVQAATNMLLGHFLSMVCSLWLLSIVGEGRGLRFQRFLSLQRLKQRAEDNKVVISKGNLGTFILDSPLDRAGGSAAQAAAVAAAATRSVGAASSRAGRGGGGGGSSSGGGSGGAGASLAPSALQRSARGGWDLVGPGVSTAALLAGASARTSALTAAASTSSTVSTSGLTVGGNGVQWGGKVRVGQAIVPSAGSRSRRGTRTATALATTAGPRALTRGNSMTSLMARREANGGSSLLILADSNSLSYLDGTLPGDMGFDPLGLFAPGPETGLMNQAWLRYSEVLHGRWAMLGVVGCLAPEFLAYEHIIPEEHGVVWFRTGFLPTAGQDYDFGTDPVSLTWVMMILMGFAETRRYQDFISPGSLASGNHLPLALDRALSTPPGQDPVYPGGPIFNFLGVVESESATEQFKEKEIRHGRLAMVACLGLFAQALATHEGPYINLLDHMFDPLNCNVFQNFPSTFSRV